MKAIKKQILVDYIVLDDGTEISYSKLQNELMIMAGASWTEFFTLDKCDMSMYQMIKERYSNGIESEYSDEYLIRVYWKGSNTDFIGSLLDEIYEINYKD